MSSVPAKILLATDGSEKAELAAMTAVSLANSTDSVLHVVPVAHGSSSVYPYCDVTFPEEVVERFQREAREVLDEQVERIEATGGSVAGAHLRTGALWRVRTHRVAPLPRRRQI